MVIYFYTLIAPTYQDFFVLWCTRQRIMLIRGRRYGDACGSSRGNHRIEAAWSSPVSANHRPIHAQGRSHAVIVVSLSRNIESSESYVFSIQHSARKTKIQRLVVYRNRLGYPAHRRCCCLAVPCLSDAKQILPVCSYGASPPARYARIRRARLDIDHQVRVVTNPESSSQSRYLSVRSFPRSGEPGVNDGDT